MTQQLFIAYEHCWCCSGNYIYFWNSKGLSDENIAPPATDEFSLRSSYPTLENCLFGVINLTKNADIVKYKYFGYGIGFDRQGNMVIDLVEIV